MTDILTIKSELISKVHSVCEHLLPRGVVDKRDWCVGSVAGEPGNSLKVCLSGAKAGRWADFATGGELRGDLLDIWCAVRGCALPQALDEARAFLGMKPPEFDRDTRKRVWRRPDKPKCIKPKSDVLEYLTAVRKISAGAIAAYRIGEAGKTIVFHSFLPDGELAFVKYLEVDRPDGKKVTRVEANCEPVLFGWQAIPDNERRVVICEGESDALSLHDYGFPALSVPFGGGKGAKQQWIESEYERLGRFEVIYLALDNDEEGQIAAEEIANRIGRHRCRLVKLPRKDANQCAMDGVPRADIESCFAAAASCDPPELRRVGAFVDDVINLFWPDGTKPVGSSLPFAKIGGKLIFRPGEVTIWTGASGTGKSQVLSHATVGWVEQGDRVCIASLEMKPAQLLRRMVKQAGNVDRPTPEFIRDIIEWMDRSVWLFDLVGKSPVKRLLEVFEYARARYGCNVFEVDSMMRLGVGSEDYEGQEKAVYQLVEWATANNVHLHLVAHARKADRQAGGGVPETEDIKGAAEIGFNAFNIVAIWRNLKLEDEIKQLEGSAPYDPDAATRLAELLQKPTVMLNIAKQRNGDHTGKCGLWFNPATYQYRSAEDDRFGRQYVTLNQDMAAE